MRVAQSRVGGGLPRSPGGGGAGGGGLVPDDLTAHQKAKVDQLLGDQAIERDIGFASQVGNVHARPSARDQHAVDFLPYPPEKGKVFIERQVFIVLLAHVIGRRSHHEMDRAIRQLHHGLGGVAENDIHAGRRVFHIGFRTGLGLVRVETRFIERGRVVPFASR